ncbi:MAG: hypothetical protein ACI9E1_001067 [Cryomorphaceae bacterium]|jgi:hypothetical protein
MMIFFVTKLAMFLPLIADWSQIAKAKILLWGSDLGPEVSLGEMTVHSKKQGRLKNTRLIFTAPEQQATGQTLGISLGCDSGQLAAFDRVRLGALIVSPDEVITALDSSSVSYPEIEPQLISLFPMRDNTAVLPGSSLRMTFDQPISMGKGRVTIRDESNGNETVLIA